MGEESPVPRDRLERVETFVGDWVADEGVPGVSVAITRRDGETWTTGIGSRDLETNAPATGETLYGLGSITKSVTALAVLQLVDRGTIDLDDAIDDYLTVSIPGTAARTIHDVLTHNSGIPSLATSEALIARHAGIGEAGVPLGDREDVYHHLAGADDFVGPPGRRFMYCNLGYNLLADLITAVDGRQFPAYVRDEVLDPLGMDRSTFSKETFAADSDRITPYRLTEEGTPEETPLPVRELSWGAGGLLSSVRELARYLQLQLEGGELGGNRLVSAELLERAHEGHVATAIGPYGYGWRTRCVADRDLIGHGGSIAVSTAYAGFLPDDDLAVAVAANTSPGYSLAHLGEAIAATAVGEDPRSVPYFVRQRRLERITGEYTTYRGIRTATVDAVDGQLSITFEDPFGEEHVMVSPTDPLLDSYEFVRIGDRGERRSVTFELTDEGVDLNIDRWHLRKT